MAVLTRSKSEFFRNNLLRWHKSVSRPMPWKGAKDPYKVWISEIMLQQTRVEQAKGYFLRFIDRFPSVHHLANATETEVLKYWEGLGYYRRARYIHEAANSIVREFEGTFPDKYKDIRSLNGVGEYTAAAIASFAYGQPYAVVDGNVERIIARYLGIREEITLYKTRKAIGQLAAELIDRDAPAAYNQAIMDFGAIHCTPANPKCDQCPLSIKCKAYLEGSVDRIPKKSKSKKRKKRYFHYLLLKQKDQYLFTKREGKDIWNGMFEFPLIEKQKKGKINIEEASQGVPYLKLHNMRYLEKRSQILSHQEINMYFYHVNGATEGSISEGMIWQIPETATLQLPVPKTIGCFLRDKSLHLNNI